MNLTSPLRTLIKFILILGISNALNADEEIDGHFSSWKDVPELIESITVENYNQPLEDLTRITRIQLGDPHGASRKEDFNLYLQQTKERWQEWWKTTGKPTMDLNNKDAKIDAQALQLASKFLGKHYKKPKEVLPVWIPKTWTLYVSFTNGDYHGREKELWVIDQQEDHASFTKLRGDYSKGQWSVSFSKLDGFTKAQADRTLKALCYTHRYSTNQNKEEYDKTWKSLKLYYATATLNLRDGENRILWNVFGGDFEKSRDKNNRRVPGRSYYFLRSMFGDNKNWKNLTTPTSEELAPYRTFLANNKPYSCSLATEVILLLSNFGHIKEREALLAWTEKQKAAIDPEMDWKIWATGDFYTHLETNVINSTRIEFESTIKQLDSMGKRLKISKEQLQRNKVLDQDVIDMLTLKKQEEEADIMRLSQPLRDLVRANRHPNDPDLKHLISVIEHIRKKPDPKLFKQIAGELNDVTVEMRSLLEIVLLDKRGFLEIQPWGDKEKTIAVNACIDSIPIADRVNEARNLVTVILKASGGGKIEFKTLRGDHSVSLKYTKDGYSSSSGGASNPLPLEDAQKELKKIFSESQTNNK